MTVLFTKLPPDIQERALLANRSKTAEFADADRAYHMNRLSSEEHIAMWQATLFPDPVVVEALLDLGSDVNVFEASGITHSPLMHALVSATSPNCEKEPAQRQKGFELVDLLLARGADPNFHPTSETKACYTPMYRAVSDSQALQRLLDKGGNIHVVVPGIGSLLDEWLNCAGNISAWQLPRYLEALDMLLNLGVDPKVLPQSGSSFLVTSWGSARLRPLVPLLIEKGFEPYQKGTAKGRAGDSLFEHLERKLRNGRGSLQAQTVMASLVAQGLDGSTPNAQSRRPSPRI